MNNGGIIMIPEAKKTLDKNHISGVANPSKNLAKSELLDIILTSHRFIFDKTTQILFYRKENSFIWYVDENLNVFQQYILSLANDVYVKEKDTILSLSRIISDYELNDMTRYYRKFITLPNHRKISPQSFRKMINIDSLDKICYELPLIDAILQFFPYENIENRFLIRSYTQEDFYTFCYQISSIDFMQYYKKDPEEFKDYLSWLVSGDKDEYDLLSFSLGAMLLPFEDRWNSIIYLYGNGKNGKSVLNKFYNNLYNKESVAKLSMANLHNTQAVPLAIGKWFINGNESRTEAKTDYTYLRLIADMESITVNPKYVTPYTVRIHARAIFSGNYPPTFRNAGDERRINFFFCKNKVQEVIPDYENTFNRASVFAYLLNYIADHNLNFEEYNIKVENHSRVTADIAENPLSEFLSTYLRKVQTTMDATLRTYEYNYQINCVSVNLAYKAYIAMCNIKNSTPAGRKSFTRYLNSVMRQDSRTRLKIADSTRRVFVNTRLFLTESLRNELYKLDLDTADIEELDTYEA